MILNKTLKSITIACFLYFLDYVSAFQKKINLEQRYDFESPETKQNFISNLLKNSPIELSIFNSTKSKSFIENGLVLGQIESTLDDTGNLVFEYTTAGQSDFLFAEEYISVAFKLIKLNSLISISTIKCKPTIDCVAELEIQTDNFGNILSISILPNGEHIDGKDFKPSNFIIHSLELQLPTKTNRVQTINIYKDEHLESKMQEDSRSFIMKYWYVFLPAVLLIILNNSIPEEPENQPGQPQ